MTSIRSAGGGILVVALGVVLTAGGFGSGRDAPGAFAHGASPSPAKAQAQAPAGNELYQKFCQACHGADGRGTAMKQTMPAIPDFTSTAWHDTRNNVELLISILDGKGTLMPAFNDRVTEDQARDLVSLTRAFKQAQPKLQP